MTPRRLPVTLPATLLAPVLTAALVIAGPLAGSPGAQAAEKPAFAPMDVFALEWAAEPEVAPDGAQVVYRRMGFDVMTDQRRGSLWLASADGSGQHKLTSFDGDESGARWSPDGSRIAYVRSAGDKDGAEIFVHWLTGGQDARITQLPASPNHLRWSPDGRNWFSYFDVRYPGTPWTNPDEYLKFSPISLVGNVTTPTLVMVGLDDLRTPPSQAKQLYQALK